MKKKFELSATALKVAAVIAMTIDHCAFVFVPDDSAAYFIMRFFGRLTAPIMSFFIAEGFVYTKSRKKYFARLLIFGLISQPFYITLILGRIPTTFFECHKSLCISVQSSDFIIELSCIFISAKFGNQRFGEMLYNGVHVHQPRIDIIHISNARLYLMEEFKMEEKIYCSHCGEIIEGDEYDTIYVEPICQDCVEDYTTVCDRCDAVIWDSDAYSDENTTLCCRCYDNYYTRCEHCDSIIHNDDSYE